MSQQSPSAPSAASGPAGAGGTLQALSLIVMGGLFLLAIVFGFWMYRGDGYQGTDCSVTKMRLCSLEAALLQYKTQNGFYPSQFQGLEALVICPSGDPKPRAWVQFTKPEGIVDPWGRKMQYRYPGKHNVHHQDVFSLGPDGVESADDIGNW